MATLPSVSEVYGFDPYEVFYEPDSPIYPLPSDYDKLSPTDQRFARVAAIRRQSTPMDMVYAWDFMRRAYLDPLPPGAWYPPPKHPSPPLHYAFVHDLGTHARNAWIMPRSFAKSTIVHEMMLLWGLGRTYFRVLVIKSMDDFVYTCFSELMQQFTTNELILRDFGELKPRRGEGAWSQSRLRLTNGNQFYGRSVTSRLLGMRPDIVILDDAEFDPAMRVSPTLLTENMKYLMFNHVIPMLDAGKAALLVGTLFARSSFIYHVVATNEEEDPRLGFWNRVVYGVMDDNDVLTWPEKFPKERIESLRIEVGPTEFSAQYMNRPISDQERPLRIHPHFGYYTVADEDEYLEKRPLSSNTKLVSWLPAQELDEPPVVVERPYGETVSKMTRIMVADPIRSPSRRSDFACIMVIGIEKSSMYRDVWWVLDMKLGKPTEAKFISWLWELGSKWKPRVVGVEAISVHKALVEQAATMFADRTGPLGWTPRVRPIKYTGEFKTDKASRIMGLGWRFDQNKIKLPRHLCSKPPFSTLYDQIELATPNLALLQHDDAVDTLAMPQFLVKPSRSSYAKDTAPKSVKEMLLRGEKFIPGTTIPLITCLNAEQIDPEIQQVLDNERYQEYKNRGKKPETKKTPRGRPHIMPGGKGTRVSK